VMTKVLVQSRLSFAVAALLTLAGCGSDTTTSPTIKSGLPTVEALSQISIEGIVGKIASPAPAIRVTDSKTHKPLANVPVEFRVVGGPGSVTNSSSVTDAMGLASAGEWTFSQRPGPSYLSAYVNGTPLLMFTATLKPDVPAHLVAITPIDQAGLPGSEIAGPAVYVQDRYLNPVPDVVVRFAMADDRTQSLERATWISDNSGRAVSGAWTLGSTPGITHTTASVPGVETLVFNAQILDLPAIKWYTLDSVRVGTKDYTPVAMGISEARFGVTSFDPCLCKKQDGYFIDEVAYSGFGGQIYSTSGRYVLDGPTLTISSLTYPGAIESGHVLLQRPDLDFGFVLTWVYKEI
jgi:hypothetical protein